MKIENAFSYLLHVFKNENKIKTMKLKKSILEMVAGSYKCRKELMETLEVSAPTMSRYISDNDDNLTKIAALKVISKNFNHPIDSLTEETVTA